MTTVPFHFLSLDEGQVSLADLRDDVRGLVVLVAHRHLVPVEAVARVSDTPSRGKHFP